jgi:TRAP-type transport system periplasmic protein
LAAAALVVHAGLGGGEPPGKSGAGTAVTLTLAAPADAETTARRFAAKVDSLSHGALRVSIRTHPQRIEQLGLLPSHALAAQTPELQVLDAPFLVPSYGTAVRVTSGPLGERLQVGLSRASLTGLALVPEGLYRVFGYLAPLESPGDFTGTTIRAPSATTRALRALGARPVGLDARGDTVVSSGFESSRTPGHTFPEDAVTAANVVLAPRIDVLAASSAAFARLTRDQRTVLRRAALEARAETIAATGERSAAAAFCRAGGTVVTAPPSALRALRAKTAPLLAELRRDPDTSGLLARLERTAAAPAPAPQACAPGPSPALTADGHDPSPSQRRLLPPAGSYRRAFTTAELQAAGAQAMQASANAGLTTFTVYGPRYDLRFAFEWPGTGRRPCRGRLAIASVRLTKLRWNLGTPCTGDVAFRWRLDDGDLVLTAVEARTGWLARAYPGTWKRVDCAPWTGWPGPAHTDGPRCGGGRTPSPSGAIGTVGYAPSGKRVVYAWGNVLVVANVDGSGVKTLLRRPEARGRCPCDRSPAFSPDGARVAFVRRLDDGRRAWFVVHVDGSNLRRVTPWSRTQPGRLAWSAAER